MRQPSKRHTLAADASILQAPCMRQPCQWESVGTEEEEGARPEMALGHESPVLYSLSLWAMFSYEWAAATSPEHGAELALHGTEV